MHVFISKVETDASSLVRRVSDLQEYSEYIHKKSYSQALFSDASMKVVCRYRPADADPAAAGMPVRFSKFGDKMGLPNWACS